MKGSVREVIDENTKIKSTNKGYALLAKLGWTEGQPLGISGEGAFEPICPSIVNLSLPGRIDPVPLNVKRDQTGIGKASQDAEMIETTVAQRRELDSEKQRKESEEQRRSREVGTGSISLLGSLMPSSILGFRCSSRCCASRGRFRPSSVLLYRV